jgi:hypothetical protein
VRVFTVDYAGAPEVANIDRVAEQCVAATADTYQAAARARLYFPSPTYDPASLDPASIQLELASFGSANCQGDPLAEQSTTVVLNPGMAWQTLRLVLVAPAGSVAVRFRLRTVADPADGLEVKGSREVLWDNAVLHPS